LQKYAQHTVIEQLAALTELLSDAGTPRPHMSRFLIFMGDDCGWSSRDRSTCLGVQFRWWTAQ
jgi:hypothetical protein